MTFELSPQHLKARDQARAFAVTLQESAGAIDRTGAIAPDTARAASALAGSDPLTLVLAVEEIARVSAAVAATPAAQKGGRALGISGLRGATTFEDSPRTHLALAAVALGVGRAATDVALGVLRASTDTPGADVEKPHWVIADVATELDAARLLTYNAALSTNDADVAIARLMATAAASRAVDAAVRVVGQAALEEGSTIERLVRDVRALAVVLGTEEDQRAVAADSLFPR